MTRRALPPGHPSFARFRDFRYSVFRLETLQVYNAPDPGLDAFRRGDPFPPASADEVEWSTMLRANRDAARIQQRVHVVRDSIPEYLAYELTWQYGLHVAAGEDIRIISATDDWPLDVPREDFWLFDAREVYWMRYDTDGTWLGSEWTTEPVDLARACSVRDAALVQSRPWREYIAARPDLAARVPPGVW